LKEYKSIQEYTEKENAKPSPDKFRITYKNTSDETEDKSKPKEIHTVNRPDPIRIFYGPLENIQTMVFWFWK